MSDKDPYFWDQHRRELCWLAERIADDLDIIATQPVASVEYIKRRHDGKASYWERWGREVPGFVEEATAKIPAAATWLREQMPALAVELLGTTYNDLDDAEDAYFAAPNILDAGFVSGEQSSFWRPGDEVLLSATVAEAGYRVFRATEKHAGKLFMDAWTEYYTRGYESEDYVTRYLASAWKFIAAGGRAAEAPAIPEAQPESVGRRVAVTLSPASKTGPNIAWEVWEQGGNEAYLIGGVVKRDGQFFARSRDDDGNWTHAATPHVKITDAIDEVGRAANLAVPLY